MKLYNDSKRPHRFYEESLQEMFIWIVLSRRDHRPNVPIRLLRRIIITSLWEQSIRIQKTTRTCSNKQEEKREEGKGEEKELERTEKKINRPITKSTKEKKRKARKETKRRKNMAKNAKNNADMKKGKNMEVGREGGEDAEAEVVVF